MKIKVDDCTRHITNLDVHLYSVDLHFNIMFYHDQPHIDGELNKPNKCEITFNEIWDVQNFITALRRLQDTAEKVVGIWRCNS